ncbi:MAG: hypothetical protein DMG05_17285 [Acidobacteria bacterium]|nr:MAG: hypothetical protein DMG05_17285 [Acidobacteriota bacterium]
MVGGILAKIFWDTNLFIYLMEENPTFAHRVAEIRRGMLSRGDNLYTSAFTVGEILVKPSVTGRSDLESQYRAFFSRPGIAIISFDLPAAHHYAQIRQDPTIQRPDAIQLACGAAAEIDLFITNDERLSRKFVRGIQFITSLERAPI